MNISSINNTPLPGASPRPAESVPAEVRQLRQAQNSSSLAALTENPVSQPQKSEANREQLEDAIKKVNDFLKPINNSIQFSLDDDTGKTVVKVVDVATKDIIRQFPSEEMLDIARAIDKMKGLLIQQKA